MRGEHISAAGNSLIRNVLSARAVTVSTCQRELSKDVEDEESRMTKPKLREASW